ncbi:MAG: glycoside hydrolase family 31 protein [Deltaproteobacteria bacterium]|nr:glycoside hydrolase family 31 protein [Deltaproteobacteria bacterium]
MKRTVRLVVFALPCLLFASCGSESPPGDVVVGEGPAATTVTRSPFDLRVELTDGTSWGAPGSDVPELGLLSFGAYSTRMNPARYYDPMAPAPGSWIRPGRVRSATVEGGHAVLDVEIDPLVGDGLDVELTRDCDRPPSGGPDYRCWTTVSVRVREPGSVAFTRLAWALEPDEGLYGLGERFDAPEARGRRHAMQMELADTESGLNEVHVPVPWVVSTRGYAVLVEDTRPAGFDLGATDGNVVTATFASVGFTFHVVTSPDPWVLAGGVAALTGAARIPPAWAFGPQMWRNELADGAELLADAAAIRANDLPVSVLWIDNPWQTAYNDFTFNAVQFPDAAAMIGQLHDAGYKVLAWSTPYLDSSDDSGVRAGMNPDTGGLFEEAEAAGHFVQNSSGHAAQFPWTSGKMGAMIDFTGDAARAWWTETARRATGLGIDGFKLDYGELTVSLVGSRLGLRFADGSTEAETHNVYSTLYHRAYRAAVDADRPDGFLIGRASTLGGQQDVDCIWPGDLDSDLSYPGDETPDGPSVGGLASAVHALQSLAVSGFPTFGSDTGGFRNGAPTSETLVRWAAHTAFTPVMQLGGGGDSHNPWDTTQFPEDWVLPAMRKLMKLHQQLFPYLYVLVCEAAADPSRPSVMPLGLVYPDDNAAREDDCAYLLGPRLLVAPGCRGEDPRRVHLPAGTWVDWWTGDVHAGPTDIDAPNPVDAAPVFLAAGAIVPMLPAELDTMVETGAADTVDPGDAAGPHRLRIVPAIGEETTWDITAVPEDLRSGFAGVVAEARVQTRDDCVSLNVTRRDEGAAVVLELDWQVVSPEAPGRVEGVSFVEAPDVETVLDGCDGCWFHDGTTGKVFASPVPARVCR